MQDANTPTTPSTEQQPTEPTKVTFSPEQQSKLNQVIKEVSARAGAEARAEAARLKAENDQLRAQQEPDAEIRTRLSVAERERDSLRQANSEAAVMQQIREAMGDQWADSQLAADLLKQSVRMVEGKPVVMAADGTPALNASFEAMTLREAAQQLAAAKPFLVRSTLKGGIGSLPASLPAFQTETAAVHALFGPQGDVERRNKLALNSPNEYRRLRNSAKALGLV